MTAGKIILSYSGKNDIIILGNPNIDFWKYTFQRHTNFSMQSIELECDDKITLSDDHESIFKFKVHRYADLLNYMYLTINLPNIYSNTEEFSWVKYLGCSMLNYARLYFDNNLIEEIDGRYLYMFNKINHTKNQSKYFDKLVGNIPQMYSPYSNNIYKSSYNTSFYNKNDIDKTYSLNKNYNSGPSIPEYTLNIPLLFTFFSLLFSGI